jgi:hypothetical protein
MEETETCPYCGEAIPVDEWNDHDKGKDAKRPACPHQDLDEIVAGQSQRWKPGVALPDAW